MIDIIIKRDGRKVPFDPQKITDAIMKAFQASILLKIPYFKKRSFKMR